MSQDDFKPKLGRVRDAGGARLLKHTTRVFRQAGKAGVRALRQKGHVSPSALSRGMGAGVRAAAGLIAPDSRRVIVKARYTRIVGGDLGAARAHLKYILRDGVTREGMAGHLYDASHDEADGSAFLARSEHDPHQFRFIVSPEDSARLADLKPFIRDLLAQMERDLETRLDWIAVDHFNTGHPHTHIVIRGRDDQGRDLVMARDYIAHGVRARAQGLITLELGPETDLERTQKLFNETGQERLTRLDRSLLARTKDGILVVTTAEEQDPLQQTLRIGRLRTLERLGLAQERQQGVWQLDGKLESKLRRLGDRADKFRTMQQVLRELGIDRGTAAMALFERGPRCALATRLWRCLMNDPALIAALLDRNPGAGRSFIERHDAFLRRVVLSASPAARGLVDDLTHDVYVHLWRDDFRVLRQWQRERPLRAYLHTVITRLVWDRLSSLQPAWEQLDDDPWTAAGAQRWASDQPPTPEEEVAAKEVTRIVRNALDGLDGSSSQVVELRYFRELSYGEIADLVGITRSNVGVRLNRALSRLKEALTKALMPRTVLP